MRFVRFIFTGNSDCDRVLHWIANNRCPIRSRKGRWEFSRGRYMRQGKLGLNLVWFGRCLLQEKILSECFFGTDRAFFRVYSTTCTWDFNNFAFGNFWMRHLATPSLPATPSFPVRKNQKAFFPQEIGV